MPTIGQKPSWAISCPVPSRSGWKEPAHEEIADGYDDASILFADIAGFTAMSNTPPAEVVRFLDHLYTDLDALAEKYRLEDQDHRRLVHGRRRRADPRSDHLRDLARFALDMFEVAGNVPGADGRRWGCGSASPPARSWRVWWGRRSSSRRLGDAVNLASRMESTGVVGRIQVTTDVRDRLAGEFAFRERGPVRSKARASSSPGSWKAPRRRPRPDNCRPVRSSQSSVTPSPRLRLVLSYVGVCQTDVVPLRDVDIAVLHRPDEQSGLDAAGRPTAMYFCGCGSGAI